MHWRWRNVASLLALSGNSVLLLINWLERSQGMGSGLNSRKEQNSPLLLQEIQNHMPWRSSGLLIRWSGVRFPPGSLAFPRRELSNQLSQASVGIPANYRKEPQRTTLIAGYGTGYAEVDRSVIWLGYD